MSWPRQIVPAQLCTYGFTGRALLHAVCGSDPARFHGMKTRLAVLDGLGSQVAGVRI